MEGSLEGLAILNESIQGDARLFRLQFGDQLGNVVERLLIQYSTRNNLKALNLDIDLIELTAHELAPAFARVNVDERCTHMLLICFRCHSHPEGTRQELVSWNPCSVPSLQNRVAKRAFKAGDLALWSQGFGSAVERAALAGSVTGF